MFVAAKTPVFAQTVTHGKFVVSKIRMSDSEKDFAPSGFSRVPQLEEVDWLMATA
jgi:hypothetical protein